MTDPPATDPKTEAYQVLARKYRPARFTELIGQDAAVRTLTNALKSGRMAQAFILTGVRGVGKTTTARIIARALNCVGADGAGGPTPEPCGLCENCVAIAEDRHVDVMEMDAASRTGIDDIRELIEGVRYRPVQARTKVYIVDEVHMLSRQAFNGLLKTLEEPPEHVVFIFATTEVRKVPVTVLSRCQRFDLRRLDRDELAAHYARSAEAEGVAIAHEALAMIARAADGSVRDGLSLLDQAIALSGAGRVEAEGVRAMLGLADRAQVFDLFEAVMGGRAPEALGLLGALHESGADPAIVLQDLLEVSHFVTRAKLVPETLEGAGVPETERLRGGDLAHKLALSALARAWQVLLKGLGEARVAPAPLQAAEMVLIRLAYAGALPSPAELVQRLAGEDAPAPQPAPAPAKRAAPAGRPGLSAAGAPADTPAPAAAGEGGAQAAPAPLAQAEPAPEVPETGPLAAAPQGLPPASFPEVVALVRARKETILANHLEQDVHLVRFEPGRIEFRPSDQAPRNLAGQLGGFLQALTGARWMVSVSQEQGAPSLAEQAAAREAGRREAALGHPLVQAAMAAFPGAELVEVREARGEPGASSGAAEPANEGDERP
ncbi:MAG: DNA polymerase III subunit gamma/tau [Kiloniellales bacterium]